RNNLLALIQINSIPIEEKSIVILFELNHFPDLNSTRQGNEIYAWGDMGLELQQARQLLTWPITAELINIQLRFAGWYSWARSLCREMGLSHHNDVNNDSCSCHPPSPYKVNELWSLQKAFLYIFNLFIDKTYQRSNWSSSLSSKSSLSSEQQQNMIHYAVHDVLAVTYLIRPVLERWSFIKLKHRMVNEIFISFEKIQMPSPPPSTTIQKKNKIKNINWDIESISSDDEVYVNQLVDTTAGDGYDPVDDTVVLELNELIELNETNDEQELNELELNELDDEQKLNGLNDEQNYDNLEQISDDDGDEIYLNQLIDPVNNNELAGEVKQLVAGGEDYELVAGGEDYELVAGGEDYELVAGGEDYELVAGGEDYQLADEVNTEEVLATQDVQDINDDQQIESNEPAQYQRKSSYQRRSRSAKMRHNRKHARQQKKHRFDHQIRRKFYHRFKSFMIRRILRLYQIP
ncbi:unnamed protein product, partial [Adineta steineri]